MENSIDRVWVEAVGKIIVARIKGEPTTDLLDIRHERVIQTAKESASTKLLLDDLQMAPPTYAQIEHQRTLNADFARLGLKIAVLVPNSQMAYLARLKFDQENHKVFYNEMVDAVNWLSQGR